MEKSKLVIWLEKYLPMVFLVIIRVVEMFSSSIIPSIISVMVVFIRPSEQAWDVMILFAFIMSTLAYIYFWMDYAAERESVKEFYIVNGSILGAYIAVSILGYYIFGDLVYSLSYANLRVLEFFFKEIKTFYSIIVTDVFMVLLMIACERYSRHNIEKIKTILRKNATDKVEMEDAGVNVVPTKENRKVELLTVEQMEEQIISDENEYAAIRQKAAESVPENMWNDDFTKGKGESFERIDYSSVELDLDEHDYRPDSETENKNKNYSSDALWNKEIYRGRTEGDKPITDFSDEDDKPTAINEGDDFDDETLWSKDMYRGINKERLDLNYDNEEDEYRNAANANIPYESDSLWDNQFYKGRDQQNKPEHVIDLSDEVTMEQKTDNEGYSSDSLWDNIRQGDGLINETDEEINPNQDYDSDALWSRDIYQGRNKNE